MSPASLMLREDSLELESKAATNKRVIRMRRSLWNAVAIGSVLLLVVMLVFYHQILTGAIQLPFGPRPLLAQSESDKAPSLASTGLAPGEVAPNFTLPSLDGEPMSLSDFRGQPVLINFWATWCPPCRNEMPAIQRVYAGQTHGTFVVVAINLRESEDTVRSFVEEMGLSFPILLDERGEVMERYKVMGLPSSFFLAPDGTIHVRRVGEMTEEFIERTTVELLASDR